MTSPNIPTDNPAHSAPRQWLNQFHLAAVFLTRLPMPLLPTPCPTVGQSLWAFPLIGALLGAGGGALALAGEALSLPPTVLAVLVVAVLSWLTGALHEDGLADLADGFGGGTTRARKLEILRDSRIGSYGVVALVLLFALRLSSLAALGDGLTMSAALITAHALGRAMIGPAMRVLSPAQSNGLGASAGTPSLTTVAAGILWAVLMAGGALASVGLAVAVLPALIAAGVALAGVCLLARRHIGGYTGDVLGAVAIVGEGAVLLTLSAFAQNALG